MYKMFAITILSALLFVAACAPVFIPVRPFPRYRHGAIWGPGHHHYAPWGGRNRHWQHH